MLAFAWSGAVLFASALLYCAYFYLVELGRPVAGPAEARAGHVVFNLALFSGFALHHSAAARLGFKAWAARWVPPTLERSVYVWMASLLLLAACLLWRPLPGVAWQASGLARWALHAVQVAGLIVTLRSAARIDIWELAGVRHITSRVEPRVSPSTKSAESASSAARPVSAAAASSGPSELEIRGPYRWVRHPIYLGWVLMVFGAPAMTAGRLLFASVSTLYLIVAIPFEERSLTAEFGPAYTAYQRRVRWRLLPGVW